MRPRTWIEYLQVLRAHGVLEDDKGAVLIIFSGQVLTMRPPHHG